MPGEDLIGPPQPWQVGRQRAVRAIALLEAISTVEARGIRERLASGAPESTPTRAARIALENLE
jgi:hypothetical protein